jgi:alginate O-acetyltransferase complex protein AlgI
LDRAPRPARHVYAILVVMVGWVFFRADSLPQALHYLRTMADAGAFAQPTPALSILANAQAVGALIAGSLFAFPLLPVLMERLRIDHADVPHPELPARLDTRSIHALPIPLLATAFVLCIALLVGSTLNPFLYFRF